MRPTSDRRPPARCPTCATEWGPAATVCPRCQRLVHAAALERLAQDAREAGAAGDMVQERAHWRSALELLPPESKQAERIRRRIESFGEQVGDASATAPKRRMPKWLAALGGVGLFVWKAKAILVFVATKGKLLLTGFASWPTLLSMLFAFGVYWSVWGWAFALGLLLSIYVHEMGHVAALSRYGIRASAPMFIPGVGAFVRLDQRPATAREDARIGLAGPWWGLLAAVLAWLAHLALDNELLGAIAKVGAWINLFNLLPFWQLDGGRAFRSLSARQRWIATALLGATWFLSGEWLLVPLAVGAAFQALFRPAPQEGDRAGMVQYGVVVVALTALASIDVSTPL